MSITLRNGLPARVPVTISVSSPVGVTPPAAASRSLTRVLVVCSGKRPGLCTWPSTATWLPRTSSSTMLTCGRLRNWPLRSAVAILFSASAMVEPPRLTAPTSG